MSPNNLNDESGHETPPSAEQSVSVGANQLFNMTTPPVQVAIDRYMVYAGTVSGTRYLQTTTPATVGADWTEPASCPSGHTCISGTSIMNDTITTPTTNDACPGPGAYSVGGGNWHFTYPTGLTHSFARGFFKFHKNDPGVSDLNWFASKQFYFKSSDMLGHAVTGLYNNGGGGTKDFGLGIDPPPYNEALSLYSRPTHFSFACQIGSTCSTWEYHWDWDKWYYVELETKYNTPGLHDGEVRVWAQCMTCTPPDPAPVKILELNPGNIRGNDAALMTEFGFGDQVTRVSYSPIDVTYYWDDIVVGDVYIGSQVPPP